MGSHLFAKLSDLARGSTARVMLFYARGSTARVVLIERMHKGLGPCSHCTADERRAL